MGGVGGRAGKEERRRRSGGRTGEDVVKDSAADLLLRAEHESAYISLHTHTR